MNKLNNTIFTAFITGSLGYFIGIFNNVIYLYTENVFNIKNTLLQLLTHLLFSCVIIAILEHYLKYLNLNLKNITSDLFFVSFFFGVQYNMFSDTVSYILQIFGKK